MNSTRIKDGYEKHLRDFMQNIYVVCPTCHKQAIIKSTGSVPTKATEAIIKIICTTCGYNKSLNEQPDTIFHESAKKIISGKIMITGGAIDPYFHLPLWLTCNCCDNLLWAYNFEHLHFLEQLVGSKFRERNTVEQSNTSIASRLPKWMISKKNRAAVLKSIAGLNVK